MVTSLQLSDLQLALDATKMGVFKISLPEESLLWDDPLLALYELSSSPRTLDEWAQHLHPEDRARFQDRLQETLKNGNELEEEFRILRPPNETRTLRLKAQSERDPQGHIIRIVGLHWDVTEDRKIERELKLESFALNEASIVAITDPQGNITFVNDNFCEITGYSREELLGKNPRVLNSNHHPKEFFDDMWNTILRGKVWKGDIRNRKKNGELYWADAVIVPRKDENGKITHFVAIRNDITKRKHMEEALRQNEKYLRQSEAQLRQTLVTVQAILDSANLAIFSTDRNGCIQSFNRGAETMLGFSAAEMLLTNQNALSFYEPNELETYFNTTPSSAELTPFERLVANVRHTGEAEERETLFVRHNHVPLSVHVTITPLRFVADELSGFLFVVQDISHRKEVEKLKNEFIATASHELRTPLASIRGAVGLLAGGAAGELGEKAKSLLELAVRNTNQLTALINEILDLEKIESGRIVFQRDPVNLVPLCRETLESLSTYATQFSVTYEFTTDLTEAWILGDRPRIIQVLTNLISNATKFSPKGSMVTVHVKQIKDQVRVSVIDRGCGISPEFRKHIFKKFCQEDGSSTRAKGGTGLGLSISKTIVEKSGGVMNYESELDKGTTFYFELPLLSSGADKISEA